MEVWGFIPVQYMAPCNIHKDKISQYCPQWLLFVYLTENSVLGNSAYSPGPLGSEELAVHGLMADQHFPRSPSFL